jgi:hypothetical protein
MVDWSRLLIRTDRPDTPEMLGYWEWLIGRDMHPLVMTKELGSNYLNIRHENCSLSLYEPRSNP